MKSWKKKWESELESCVGEMRSDVKNAKIECSPNNDNSKIPFTEKIRQLFYKRKIPILATACSLVLILILCFTLPIFTITQNKTVTTVLVEVNPSILFYAEDQKVVSLVSTNPDGDLILCNENAVNELIGKDLQTAIYNYTDILNRLGYLDGKQGMRMSGNGDQKILDKCKNETEKYLLEHGYKIAVIMQAVTESELLNRCNFNSDVIKEIGDVYKDATENVRLFLTDTKQTIENVYSTVINKENVLKSLSNQIKDDMQKLEALRTELSDIANKNSEIENSDDNPSLLKLDYWGIKSSPFASSYTITPDFANLMQEMQDKLDDYKNLHGTEILSASDLLYKQYAINFLIKIIDLFSLDQVADYLGYIAEYYDEVYELLGEIDSEAQNLLSVLTSPSTPEEYVQRIFNYYNACETQNKDNYNKVSTPITDDEYQEYLQSLITEFGSLENFWENLKKL